jgi:hypothetical protein
VLEPAKPAAAGIIVIVPVLIVPPIPAIPGTIPSSISVSVDLGAGVAGV